MPNCYIYSSILITLLGVVLFLFSAASEKKAFPEWAKILYRGIRSAIGAGIAQVVILQPDWGNPEETIRTLGVAFIAGFLPSFGMWLRDRVDEWFGWDESSLVQRTMPI